MKPVIEVCVESFEEAKRAVQAGATRIELCDNLAVGGTTPSYGTIRKCVENLTAPVMVMIRPRGGNFTYTKDEFEIMKDDIIQCKLLSVSGVVFGLLDEDGSIDEARTRELVKLSRPMQVTFHKAIDEVDDILRGVTLLKEMGIERVLSSGGRRTAKEGMEILDKMIKLASPRLIIVVAGQVTHENLAEFQKKLDTKEFHGRRLVAM